MAAVPPSPRTYGAFNGLGLLTLCEREIGRFMKVWMQTLFAPIITTLLFMTVFKLAFGDRGHLQGDFAGLGYSDFLAPGLVVMGVLQNAFQNSSSSLTIAKVQGSQVDFLMPPLSALELAIAFIVGAAARGILVGAVSLVAVTWLANVMPAHPLVAIYYAFSSLTQRTLLCGS
jgi:ABC-2 type transport system permease protein